MHTSLCSDSSFQEWSASDLCGTIVGTGVGRAFCAGGDVESRFSFVDNMSVRGGSDFQ